VHCVSRRYAGTHGHTLFQLDKRSDYFHSTHLLTWADYSGFKWLLASRVALGCVLRGTFMIMIWIF
jgi:hypothetical protein